MRYDAHEIAAVRNEMDRRQAQADELFATAEDPMGKRCNECGGSVGEDGTPAMLNHGQLLVYLCGPCAREHWHRL